MSKQIRVICKSITIEGIRYTLKKGDCSTEIWNNPEKLANMPEHKEKVLERAATRSWDNRKLLSVRNFLLSN